MFVLYEAIELKINYIGQGRKYGGGGASGVRQPLLLLKILFFLLKKMKKIALLRVF